ncbi:hypothetical protein OC834_005658 [Tilletia horrida]|nr:hypothetical protein OC834_005658 [Tilletia horrida]
MHTCSFFLSALATWLLLVPSLAHAFDLNITRADCNGTVGWSIALNEYEYVNGWYTANYVGTPSNPTDPSRYRITDDYTGPNQVKLFDPLILDSGLMQDHAVVGQLNAFYYTFLILDQKNNTLRLPSGELDQQTVVITLSCGSALTYSTVNANPSSTTGSAAALPSNTSGAGAVTATTTLPVTATGSATPSNPPSSSSSMSNMGAIIGGVVGGVVGLLAIGLLAFCLLFRRRRRGNGRNVGGERDFETPTISPYHSHSNSLTGPSMSMAPNLLSVATSHRGSFSTGGGAGASGPAAAATMYAAVPSRDEHESEIESLSAPARRAQYPPSSLSNRTPAAGGGGSASGPLSRTASTGMGSIHGSTGDRQSSLNGDGTSAVGSSAAVVGPPAVADTHSIYAMSAAAEDDALPPAYDATEGARSREDRPRHSHTVKPAGSAPQVPTAGFNSSVGAVLPPQEEQKSSWAHMQAHNTHNHPTGSADEKAAAAAGTQPSGTASSSGATSPLAGGWAVQAANPDI